MLTADRVIPFLMAVALIELTPGALWLAFAPPR